MKFIWETLDVVTGRRLVYGKPGQQVTAMIICDDTIGGAARFGVVGLHDGRITARGVKQNDLADQLTEIGYAPASLNPFAHQTDTDE